MNRKVSLWLMLAGPAMLAAGPARGEINETGVIEHSFVGWSKNSLTDLEHWATNKS